MNIYTRTNILLANQILMTKGGANSGRYPKGSGEQKTTFGTKTEEKANPAKRKLSQDEAFSYYVKVKSGEYGNNVEAIRLNQKVGQAEGIAKAYRERAGKLKEGAEKDKLLKTAYRLKVQAAELASARDSLLGRPAWHRKFIKGEPYNFSEQDIIDLITSGEFDEIMLQELEEAIGEKIQF